MRVLGFLFFLVLTATASVSQAGMVLEIVPTGPYVSDGVNDFTGTFDLRIKELTAPRTDPQSVLVLGFAVTESDPALTLAPVLLKGNIATNFFSGESNLGGTPVPGVEIFQVDANSPPFNITNFEIKVGDTVAVVPFTVLGGQFGTYSVAVPSGALTLSITSDPVTGDPIVAGDTDISVVGSISVVPEPASLAMVAIASCSGAIGVWRRNRKGLSSNRDAIEGKFDAS